MSGRTFSCPTPETLIESSKGLMGIARDLKATIFKERMNGNEPRSTLLTPFFRAANEYLKSWDDLSQLLTSAMKENPGVEDTRAGIDYEYVRNYLFAKYDYSSMTLYADGIFRGVGKTIADADDVQLFWDKTIEKAFPGCSSSIAGLLDDVTNIPYNYVADTPTGRKMALAKYRAVRTSGRLFSATSRPEIYRALEKTMTYLLDHISELSNEKTFAGMRLYISAVNHVVDYCVYTMVAFAARIYLIAAYASNYFNPNTATDSEIIESADWMPDERPYGADSLHYMKDMDDALARDMTHAREFCDTMHDLVKAVVNVTNPIVNVTYNHPYMRDDDTKVPNEYVEQLALNELFDYIKNRKSPERWGPDFNTDIWYEELLTNLKSMICDTKIALRDSHSPKDDMMHVIRGLEPAHKTAAGYKEHAAQLYHVAIIIIHGVKYSVHTLQDMVLRGTENRLAPSNAKHEINGAIRTLTEFYREFCGAVLQKMRYIEAKINYLSSEDINKTLAGMQVRVPGFEREEPSLNDYMMTGVPDSLNMDMELFGLYASPAFEAMQIYDEMLRHDPAFAGDLYLSEAVNISGIINTILSALNGAHKRFKDFCENASVQSAVKWSTDNGDKLLNMDYSGKSINILPYKDAIKFGEIAQKLIRGINAIDPKSSMKPEDIKAATKKLYPSDAVYEFFNSDDAKAGPRKYRNYLLFAAAENAVNDRPVEPVKCDGTAISQKLPVWLETVKTSKATYDAYKSLSDELQSAMNSLKNKVVSATSQQKQAEQNVDTPPAVPGENESEGGQTPASTRTTPSNPPEEVAGDLNVLLTDVQSAVNRLWLPATGFFIEYIKAHYSYLRQCYGLGTQKAAGQNNG